MTVKVLCENKLPRFVSTRSGKGVGGGGGGGRDIKQMPILKLSFERTHVPGRLPISVNI